MANERTGNYVAAVKVYERGLAVEPGHRESLAVNPQPAIYNDLGFVLERQGLSDEAARAYRKAIELEPGSATVHYNLGSSLARIGELAERRSTRTRRMWLPARCWQRFS